MAWTAPRTWIVGEVVTAAIMNTHVRDNLLDLDSRMNLAVKLVQESFITVDGSSSLIKAATTTVAVLNFPSPQTINGCTVPTQSPWYLSVVNVSSNNATLVHEAAGEGTPAKRWILPGAANLVLSLGEGVLFQYITVPVGARWVSIVSA